MSNLARCPNGHLFSARRYGAVCPHCHAKTAGDDQSEDREGTGADYLKPLDKSEKVCGWLVCIGGIRSGRSYAIKSGKNYIGRADNMDIQILGDDAIDDQCHAAIAYDKIRIGASDFLLFGFVGKQFSWEDE
jgi:hypothetical protein